VAVDRGMVGVTKVEKVVEVEFDVELRWKG
jgi:hypothetical protein